jgi:hypothetical protein
MPMLSFVERKDSLVEGSQTTNVMLPYHHQTPTRTEQDESTRGK